MTSIPQLGGSTWGWGYNDRSEVTAASRKQLGGTEVAALGATYSYDEIGNRMTSTSPILGDFGYTTNSVNQYTTITSNNSRTVLGKAPATSTITVNGLATTRIDTLFHKGISADNSNAPLWLQADISEGTTTQTRNFWLPKASTSLSYLGGNLTNDGQWSYLWDAENRLVEMATVSSSRPYRKLASAYDWTGRRLSRIVTDSSNSVISATRWLYDGWNPVVEYSPLETGNLKLETSYLWGLDISGTLADAGGVGGLLAVINSNPTTVFHPSFDGNGNITAWTQSGAVVPVCLREYDAFGNVVVEQGTALCGFGFSTKMEDPETGLLYYGHRYYSPPLGRWLNQDPIEEKGGLNLFCFAANDGANSWDGLGLMVVPTNLVPSAPIFIYPYGQVGPGGKIYDMPGYPSNELLTRLYEVAKKLEAKTEEGKDCWKLYLHFKGPATSGAVLTAITGKSCDKTFVIGHGTKKEGKEYIRLDDGIIAMDILNKVAAEYGHVVTPFGCEVGSSKGVIPQSASVVELVNELEKLLKDGGCPCKGICIYSGPVQTPDGKPTFNSEAELPEKVRVGLDTFRRKNPPNIKQ